MNKTCLATFTTCLIATGFSQGATVVPLDLPGNGVHVSGTTFTTSQTASGATFDISYTLNAFATDVSVAPFISSNGTIFGVGSVPDGNTAGQQLSVDGNDGEQLSVVGLSITNFNAGTSGLTESDIINLQFTDLSIFNGTANNDGITISYDSFGGTTESVTQPSAISLADDLELEGPSTALFLEPDNAASNNRWSVNGLTVSYDVIPEPSSSAMLLGSCALLMLLRRRF